MAKVLRTYQVGGDNIADMVKYEIVLLTRGVVCPECVEILFESGLYQRLAALPGPHELDFRGLNSGYPTVLGYKFRVVHGPGVRPGSMAVITRTEIVFK